jgi:hypothetical protein
MLPRVRCKIDSREWKRFRLHNPGDVFVGSVATHDDGYGHHQSIILDLPNAISALAIAHHSWRPAVIIVPTYG